MSWSCQKSVQNSTLFVNLIHPMIDFAIEYCVLVSARALESCGKRYPVIPKQAVLSVVSQCDAVFSGSSKMSGSGSTPRKPVPAPRRGGKPS